MVLLGLFLIYVDDILITSENLTLVHQVIQDLNTHFALKTLGEVSYFMGFEAFRNETSLYLNQSKYIRDLLQKANMAKAKSSPTSMALGRKLSFNDSDLFDQPSLYRSMTEALQYLTLTMTDIYFTVNKLSQFLQAPTVDHWNACKHLLRYLKSTYHLG